ncbi:leucine-rich repeat protein [Perkinsela sp. CCAP 1560/4]|nr:leucine-rich repeat protein [Perkinsela sp. CCAP 1560/4]|eukprot:KNH03875.1 leucine-rich repeat protein [Perkinsela sp. CCAP 1560/4]
MCSSLLLERCGYRNITLGRLVVPYHLPKRLSFFWKTPLAIQLGAHEKTKTRKVTEVFLSIVTQLDKQFHSTNDLRTSKEDVRSGVFPASAPLKDVSGLTEGIPPEDTDDTRDALRLDFSTLL